MYINKPHSAYRQVWITAVKLRCALGAQGESLMHHFSVEYDYGAGCLLILITEG